MGQSFLTDLFTVCFGFGAATTILNLVFGLGHHGDHFHMPHGGGHVGHAGSFGHGSTSVEISPLNITSVLAFLTVFGAVGLVSTDGLGAILALGLALIGGLVAGWISFIFVVQFLLRGQTFLEDDPMVGTVGTVSAPIEGARVGEVRYTRHQVRRSDGARSADGRSIGVGEEVVIIAYDGGIATVQRWGEFVDSSPRLPSQRNVNAVGRSIDPTEPRKERDA